MRYLVDTDHISLIQRPPSSDLAAFLSHCAVHPPTDIVFRVVSFHEQAADAHSYVTRARNATEVIRGYDLMSAVLRTYATRTVLPFDARAQSVLERLAPSITGVKAMNSGSRPLPWPTVSSW